MTNVQLFRKYKFSRKLLYRLAARRARLFVETFGEFIAKEGEILDIGAGICDIDKLLIDEGYQVTPLDIQNLSFNTITPLLYDGKTLPCKNGAFDTALILTVLHHTQDPARLVAEAQRAAKRVIIIEDVYDTTFRKYLTFFVDSFLNLEFSGHPHSNKADQQWRALFRALGMKLTATKTLHSFLVMEHRLYVLESHPRD
jgi:2-polyprenyl-3-methyl-5-hydroxy-6-metoxy-1,4-benzoquinol methylase